MQRLRLFGFLFVGLFLLYGQVSAQACDCDHTHPASEWKLDGTAVGLQPGDVVCLESGPRGGLVIDNVIGSPTQPIIIKNCGGQVDIETDGWYSLKIINSRYLRVTGSGTAGIEYGIRGNATVEVKGLTSDIELDHVESTYADFANFTIKTDPNCDLATWRENFVMENVSIHDNYAHGADDGEGYYIGFVFSDGYDIQCNGETTTVYGHLIENLEVYNNRSDDTGAEGMQISSAPNAHVHHNTITRYGQRPFANYQNNGMQIGFKDVLIDSNHIENGPGNGLIIFGTAHTAVNNLIVNAGADGIFVDDRAVGVGHQYLNNTIISPGTDGVSLYVDESTTPTLFKNNLIVNPGSGTYLHKLNSSVAVDESHNLYAPTVAEVKFHNPAGGNFNLFAQSPAVDAGTDLSGSGVTVDMQGTPRPYGASYDIGAFEHTPPANPLDERLFLPLVVH